MSQEHCKAEFVFVISEARGNKQGQTGFLYCKKCENPQPNVLKAEGETPGHADDLLAKELNNFRSSCIKFQSHDN